jgi:predicted nucleic acid-binding Zn ribbon protein
MESMGDALRKRLDRAGLGNAMEASVIVESANRVLPQPLRAKTIKDGTLTIEAETGRDAFFLKQEIETYLERINAALPQSIVKSIRIRSKHR